MTARPHQLVNDTYVRQVLADHLRQIEAARTLGRRQGRALARREYDQALTAALDRRIEQAKTREQRRLTTQGPIRLH